MILYLYYIKMKYILIILIIFSYNYKLRSIFSKDQVNPYFAAGGGREIMVATDITDIKRL